MLQAGYRPELIAHALAELEAAVARAEYLRSESARSEELLSRRVIAKSLAERDRAVADAADATVRAMRATVAKLEAGPREVEVQQAEAAVEVAAARLKLIRAGTREQAIAEADARLDAALARLEAVEAELAIANMNVGYCMVRAPHDGVVLEVVAPQGYWLHGEKRGIVRMYDLGRMQVRVDVRQESAASLTVGRPCLVKLESRKDTPYAGRIARIDPQGNLARDTVRVRVAIDEPDALLRIDLTVTIDFLAEELAVGDVPLVVPTAAVVRRDGAASVFVVRGGVARMLAVELGKQTATGFIVLSGIEAGEVVACSNLAMLEDGAPVRLIEASP